MHQNEQTVYACISYSFRLVKLYTYSCPVPCCSIPYLATVIEFPHYGLASPFGPSRACSAFPKRGRPHSCWTRARVKRNSIRKPVNKFCSTSTRGSFAAILAASMLACARRISIAMRWISRIGGRGGIWLAATAAKLAIACSTGANASAQ
jgi:hypothetical protein